MNEIKKNIKSNHGFTIFEIMVALFLITMIFVAIPLSNPNDSKVLETAIDDLDRAIRFATNESIIRNSIVRLSIDMAKEPPEYYVEFSTDADLLLPDPDKDPRTLKDEEEAEKVIKKIDQNFSKVKEFEEMKREVDDNVELLGIYNGPDSKIIEEGKASVYFYPSGERDSALILFGTQDEVAALEVLPFQNKTKVYFEQVFEENVLDTETQRRRIIEELHSQWLK